MCKLIAVKVNQTSPKTKSSSIAAVSCLRAANCFKTFAGAGLLLAGLLAGLNTQADTITGTIQFSGGAQLDNSNLGLATEFVSIFGPGGPGSNPGVLAGTETGNYAGIANGTSVAFTPFNFATPPAGGIIPLWTLTVGGITYSFDATSVQLVYQDSSFLNIGGQGIAHITGMQDTVGTWSITDTGGNGAMPLFTFGAATQVGSSTVPVPDEPSTLALLFSVLLPMGCGLWLRQRAQAQVALERLH